MTEEERKDPQRLMALVLKEIDLRAAQQRRIASLEIEKANVKSTFEGFKAQIKSFELE